MAKSEYLNNKAFEILIKEFQDAKREKAKYEVLIGDIKSRIEVFNKYKKDITPLLITLAKLETVLRGADSRVKEYKDKLATAFFMLSKNVFHYLSAKYAIYRNVDEDDACQEAVMICFEKIDRFNPDKGKAFNYFSTLTVHQSLQLQRCVINHNELKRKYGESL